MMGRITFLLGLCGSGKSYLGKQLSDDTGAKVYENLLSNNGARLPELVDTLQRGENCIVHEIAFCESEPRARIQEFLTSQVKGLKITWICFENDIETANWNVMHRNDGRDVEAHLSLNQWYRQVYTYPDGAEFRRITRIVLT
jgi:hypothetical protein